MKFTKEQEAKRKAFKRKLLRRAAIQLTVLCSLTAGVLLGPGLVGPLSLAGMLLFSQYLAYQMGKSQGELNESKHAGNELVRIEMLNINHVRTIARQLRKVVAKEQAHRIADALEDSADGRMKKVSELANAIGSKDALKEPEEVEK